MECYGACTDVAGVRGGTGQVLAHPEFKKQEWTPLKQIYPITPTLK
jgi:hypothetical protein